VSRVGILGGTFNPPHLGHLMCARQAHDELALDRVSIVVAAVPPHKEVPDDPGVDHRLAMCRLVCELEPWLEVCELEVHRPGPSYTITTLREIDANQPGDELILIVGADMALSLPSWHEPRAIVGLASLAVAERSGITRAVVLEQVRLVSADAKVGFLDGPRLEVSSSLVRQAAHDGRQIRDLVPDAVADYIQERRLYA
jgi:nicotinate-nucleotide adenylyltransferase